MANTDRLSSYAQWLVDNQDKRGTPEFDTVANAYRSLRQAPAQTEINPNTDGPLEGFGAAFRQGIDQPLENLGTTAEMLGAEGLGSALKNATDAPEGYVSATGQFMNADQDGSYAWRYLPKAAVEQAGQFAGSITSRAAGAAIGAATGSVVPVVGTVGGAAVGAFAGPALFEALQIVGPVAQERAKNNGREAPNAEDWTGAITTASASGALNALGPGASGILKRMLVEGGTEALQSVVEQGGSTALTDAGLSVDPRQAVAEGIIGAGSAGLVDTTIGTASRAVDAVTPSPREDTPENRASASLAQRLQTIATENGWNLRDVSTSSTEGARQTVDNAHVQLAESLKQNFADLRGILKPDVRDSLTDIENKVMAQAAYRQGRNKTKNVVGKQEIDALKKLTGDTREGEQALNNIFELNELTKLHNQGYKGGFSQFTDFANPFDNAGNTYNSAAQISNRIIGPMFTTAAAVQTGGASIPAQVAITGAGRTVDALTGRRSRVARYVRNNAKGQGLEAPTMPSLREAARDEDLAQQRAKEQAKQQEAAREAQLQQTNRDLGRKGAAPTPGSPQFVMEDATGLSKNGVARVMRIIEATNSDPIIKENIDAYRKSVDVGGRIPDISPLIRAVNMVVDSNPGLEGLRVRQPNRYGQQQQTQETTAAGPYGPTMTTQENYNRGIEENRALLSDLREQAFADKDLSKADKAKIVAALDELSRNLGKDPMAKIGSIMQTLEGVDEAAIDTYVGPYIQRIAGQQGRVSMDQGPATPSPADNPNPFNLSNEALAAIMGDLTPTPEEIAQMRAGTFKPKVKRSKEEAVQFLFERFKKAFGRGTQLEYTPENVDLISGMMATEAVRALSNDTNAIGWYDAKLKAAKAVVKLVDPSVTETTDNEVAFDFALAVTSNGQAVADNFSYAYEVYQSFKKTGKMPTASWKKGGERNASMVAAFEFFNAYSDARMNMPIQDFLDQDFTVNELKDYISRFNAVYGTSIGVPSSEGANTVVKGSYILGPKIGQGFYQNIRGNYDPLTMDIWWMRMWNRITGRPFEAEKGLPKSRANVSAAMKNLGSVETKLINESLKALNKRKVPNPEKDGLGFDAFVQDVEKRYQKFYKNYKIENGVNHKKPQFFKSTGTHVKNLKPQLQAQPKGPTEREYMRQVTQAAIEKLKSVGFNIQTADFQALMWYPEKQLFRKLGVAAGRGADNDYLDAAILLAKAKGINDAQIQETLASTGGNGTVDSGTSSSGPDAGLYQGSSRTGREEEGGRISQDYGRPILSDVDKPSSPQAALASPQVQPGVAGVLAQKMQGGTVAPPSISSVKQAAAEISDVFTIGKKGSKYEKGIKDIPTALRLAKALDYAVSLFGSQLRLRQAAGTASRQVRGQFTAHRNSDNPTKQNVILSLEPSAQLPDGERLSSLEALTTLLHEISHGIAGGDAQTGLFDFNRAYSNLYTSQTEAAVGNSFEGAIGRIMQSAVGEKSLNQRIARKILREVENLQNNLSVHAESSDGNSRAVRGLRHLIEFAERQKSQEELNSPDFQKLMQKVDGHISYVRSIPEFAVDPVWVYLYDPAMAKKVMPETSKVIRSLFANNKTITFHSHPLAMVVAIFAAILAQQAAGDDEEKKRSQQQPGLLSQGQGQGLLTA